MTVVQKAAENNSSFVKVGKSKGNSSGFHEIFKTEMDEAMDIPLSLRKKNPIKTFKTKKKSVKPKKKIYTAFTCKLCSKHFADRGLLRAHEETHSTAQYSCPECPYTCNVRKYLSRHVRLRHRVARRRECTVCGQRFHFPGRLAEHMYVHTGEKPYQCGDCGKAFNTKYSLRTHMLIHSDEKPYQCSYCEYACRDCSTLRKHQEKHTGGGRLYQCKMCDKTMKSKSKLKSHVAEQHLMLDVRKHFCPECGKGFKLKGTLNTHVRLVHERSLRCRCEVCGARLASRHNLRAHMMTHVTETPYECEYNGCKRRYKDQNGLRRHTASHYAEKVHKCDICGRGFKREARMKRHLVQHEARVRRHQCDYCGVSFYSKAYVAKHIRMKHARKRPMYICDMCDLVAYSKPSLIMHIKGHAARKNKHCSLCEATYKTTKFLNQHLEREHGIIDESKAKVNPIEVDIKTEPIEEDDVSIDLFDIEKEEIDEDLSPEAAKKSSDPEDLAVALITENRRLLKRVPEAVFDEHFIQSVDNDAKPKPKPKVNVRYRDAATDAIKKLLVEARQKQEVKALERTRRQYNERMKIALGGAPKKENIQINYFNNKLNKSREVNNKTKDLVNNKTVSDSEHEGKSNINISVNNNKKLRKKSLVNDKDGSKNNIKETSDNESDENTLNNEINKNKSLINDKDEFNNTTDDEIHEVSDAIKTKSSLSKNKAVIDITPETNTENELKAVIERVSTNNKTADVNDSENDEDSLNIEDKSIEEENSNNSTLNENEGDDNNKKSLNDEHNTDNENTDESDRDFDENDSANKTKIAINDRKRNNKSLNDDSETRNEFENDSNNEKTLKVKKRKVSKKSSLNDKNFENDDLSNNSEASDVENDIQSYKKAKNKLNFNTHQCYICFKLYETKEKLLEHCKDHFDVCNNIPLKKCPLCNHVARYNLPKHLKLVHGVHGIKLPYGRIQDRQTNDNGSRYYYQINNSKVKEIEMIPSVKNLNKLASLEIDKKAKERKDKTVAKTKLVKKGKEWIVERQKINVNDFMLPKFTEEEIRVSKKKLQYREKKIKLYDKVSDTYVDRMKKLYQIAKKNGKKMLFPCEDCEKICQTLAALKLHNRKHDPNKRPFKKKVWKHKLKEPLAVTKKTVEINTKNRDKKPQPIKNKHKCDPELKEFYEKNIRGGDIEFWQFLKIFNKMGRENVKEFTDLENRRDFGLHMNEEAENALRKEIAKTYVAKTHVKATKTNVKVTKTNVKATKTNVKVTKTNEIARNKVNVKKGLFKRVIRMRKKDYIRRNAIKNKLRKKLAMEQNTG